MLYPDMETARYLARQHQAELRRDWEWVNPHQRRIVQSRRRRNWRLRLSWVRAQLRIAGHLS